MLTTGGDSRALPFNGPDFQTLRRKPSAITGLTPHCGVNSCFNQARSWASNAGLV